MSRRPLSPDIWEQALLNGRRIHASDDRAAQQWAVQWYEAQGGQFDGDAVEIPAPAPEPEPAEDPIEEPAEEPAEEQPRRSSRGKRRTRHDDGQFKGDDPATPDVNEAWDGGDAA